VDTPLALVQVRSVIRQYTARRRELLDSLEICWQLNAGGTFSLSGANGEVRRMRSMYHDTLEL